MKNKKAKRRNDADDAGAPADTQGELQRTIEEVKIELKSAFEKTEKSILRLGKKFVEAGARPESVCEELKIALVDLITDRQISEKTIERCCPAEWKNAKFAKLGKKGAKAREESAGANAADKMSAGISDDADVEEPEHQEQDKVPIYEPELLMLTDGTTSQTDENLPSDDTDKTKPVPYEYGQHPAPDTDDDALEENGHTMPRSKLTLDFSLPFDEVSQEMKRIYDEHGENAKIWFTVVVDPYAGAISAVSLGKANGEDENVA